MPTHETAHDRHSRRKGIRHSAKDPSAPNAFQPSTDLHVCIDGACCGERAIPCMPVMSATISLELLPVVGDPSVQDVSSLSSDSSAFLTQLWIVDLALNLFKSIQRMIQRLGHSVLQLGVILELGWTDEVRSRETDSIVAIAQSNLLTSATASLRWYSQSVRCPRLMARVLLERNRPSFR